MTNIEVSITLYTLFKLNYINNHEEGAVPTDEEERMCREVIVLAKEHCHKQCFLYLFSHLRQFCVIHCTHHGSRKTRNK